MSEPGETRDADEPLAEAGAGRFWLRQIPYGAVLVLTILGVGYSSFSNTPLAYYWILLTLLIAVICIVTGWPRASDNELRFRLVLTQSLHWLAVLIAMNVALLPRVQSTANVDTTGLTVLLLLALGTFLAGVHVPSWQLGFLGIIMAISVPAIAWLEDSAIILVFGAIALGGIGGAIWWRWRGWRDGLASKDDF